MQSFHFEICGITVYMETEWPVHMTDNYKPFLSASGDSCDEILKLHIVENLPAAEKPEFWKFGSGYTSADGNKAKLYRLSDTSEPYLMDITLPDNSHKILYRRSSNEIPDTVNKIFNNIQLENILFRNNAVILHCSFVNFNGSGILFSAPSGTGKSTHADLWVKYFGAEILNGDRAGLRKKAGKWHAYGLPYAGSSGIYINKNVPLSAIVMLKQGTENEISALSPSEAFSMIYPEFTLHRWEEDYVEKGIDLIFDILDCVPVYLLKCRPDFEAAELVRNTIFSEV